MSVQSTIYKILLCSFDCPKLSASFSGISYTCDPHGGICFVAFMWIIWLQLLLSRDDLRAIATANSLGFAEDSGQLGLGKGGFRRFPWFRRPSLPVENAVFASSEDFIQRQNSHSLKARRLS